MNTVILTGNLVKDVKLESTKNGKPYLRNTIAVKDGYKTEFEKTYFINFETFSKDVLKVFKSLQKGNLIEIEGKLVVESYKKGDQWVNITKIVVFKAKQFVFDKKPTKEKTNLITWEEI